MKWLPGIFMVASVVPAFSQQYVGAAEVLKRIDAARNKPASLGSPIAKLKEFEKRSRSMDPKAAGDEWFQLVQSSMTRPSGEEAMNWSPVQSASVFAVLPPPASWHEILTDARAKASKTKSQSDFVLLLAAEVLENDPAGEWQALESLAASKGATNNGSSFDPTAMYVELAALNRDPVHLERALRLQARMPQTQGTMEIPDVVGVMGAAKAEPLLKDLILTREVTLSSTAGEPTETLARSIALREVAKLKTPQWGLVQSAEATELYEALNNRFPTKPSAGSQAVRPVPGGTEEDGMHQMARVYYILGLIVHGKADQAASVVIKYKGEPLASGAGSGLSYMLRKKGFSAELYTFLSKVLAAHPELPLWKPYIDVSTETGHSEDIIAQLRQGLAQTKLSQTDRTAIKTRLSDALLASGKVDEGVAMLRELISAKVVPSEGYREMGSPAQLGLKLAMIGHLLNRNDWLEEGLKDATKPAVGQANGMYYYSGSAESGPAEFLFSLGRGPEAERFLVDQMTKTAGTRGFQGFGDESLIELASIYERSGRPEDVLKLLDGSPDWDADDVAKLYTRTDSAQRPFGYVVASALASTGHKEEAATIAEAVIHAAPAYDPAYKLFLDIRGNSAIQVFKAVYSVDQFEERPLIWIAEALRRDGKLDDAEKFAKQAIQVDPSDGDQHLGTRLLAYSVLADVRDAQGAKDEAEQARTAVRAIRKAEQADKFEQAGLLSMAIKMYKDSLDVFENAYCIQSRLAVNLAEEGKYDEASEHYRKAYELMPDSFGRVETHCLGCERVFDGEVAQSVAEKVFSEFIVKTPKKPQVHYLMGYLREEEGRFAEAAARYREAVALDPQYLNAWVHLASMGDHNVLTPAERDKATLAMNRLDPQRKHAQEWETEVRDLKSLWLTLDASLKDLPLPPTALYRLAASAAAKSPMDTRFGMDLGGDYIMNPYGQVHSASEALSQTKILRLLEQNMMVGFGEGISTGGG